MKEQKPNKLSISISLMGQVLATIELSALEYAEIRSLAPPDAMRRLILKSPVLRDDSRLSALILEQIAAGHFKASERRTKT